MSLDGLRAWIGEVERKLDVRTKVMLALGAIAIGAAAVAMYLAIDTRQNAVSEGDVQELQSQLEAQIGTGDAGSNVAELEAEVNALREQVEKLEAGGGKGGQPGGASGEGGSKEGGSEAPEGGATPELPPQPGAGGSGEK